MSIAEAETSLLTKKEAAARLHVSVWALEQLIKEGLLPAVPVGARLRIRPEAIHQYVTAHERYFTEPAALA